MRIVFLLFLLLISCNLAKAEYSVSDTRVYNYSSNQPQAHSFIGGPLRKPEPSIEPELITIVDRHVLNSEDYKVDPSILIAQSNQVNIVDDKKIGNFQRAESSIQRLDDMIKKISYSSNPTTIWEARTPAQVQRDGNGNCFEVANLAYTYLTKEGYLAKVVDIKFTDSSIMHSVCIFQELDGTWSMFQANSYFVGYQKVNAKDIAEVIRTQFQNVEVINIL